MGTRNLTMVIKKEKPVVAQYGQWDGYPEGQGTTILDFIKNTDMKAFSNKLNKVRFTNDEDELKTKLFLESIGCKDGWMNPDQAQKYKELFPFYSRNHGADILRMIRDAEDEVDIVLQDSTAFAGDPLFCEWAYIINLDTNKLEVYGWHNEECKEENTFEKLLEQEPYNTERRDDDNGYGTCVELVNTFDLNNLPELDDFVEACTEKVED